MHTRARCGWTVPSQQRKTEHRDHRHRPLGLLATASLPVSLLPPPRCSPRQKDTGGSRDTHGTRGTRGRTKAHRPHRRVTSQPSKPSSNNTHPARQRDDRSRGRLNSRRPGADRSPRPTQKRPPPVNPTLPPPGKKTPVSPSIYRKDSYRYLYGTCVVRHPSSGLLRRTIHRHTDTCARYLMVSPSSDAEPAEYRASMG